jgi:outer membrane autotransporter protein
VSSGLLDGGPAGGSGASLTIRGADTGFSLGGISDYTGGTFVEGGNFNLFGSIQGNLLVTSGTFSASGGDVAGDVVIDGAQSRVTGTSGSNSVNPTNFGLFTTSMQNLTLSNGAHFLVFLQEPYPLGTQIARGPLDVRDDVSLSGTLDVADGGAGFGNGLYRLITYGGSLSGSGLLIGTVPTDYLAQHFTVQTSIPGQVNLIVNKPLAVIDRLFWDGGTVANANNARIDGGTGTWNLTNTNWTTADGTSNGVMSPVPGFVIFAGAPGTVTVSNTPGQVSVTGMQFASNGYSVTGDPILLSGQAPIIRVGDGTGLGATYVTTIAAPLSGTGGLVKSDLGTLILTGTSTYTGTTRVAFGSLTVNGTIVSPVSVESSAFLRGTGRVGATSILSGATLAPGNSIGTITIGGDLSFAAGSNYQVEVNPSASDRTNATGTATLAGGTVGVLASPGAYARQTRYTILNAAGGVSGSFAGATSNLVYLTPRLEYDANNAYLVLALNDQFSGEIHASLKSALTEDSRFVREAALDRLREGEGSGAWLRGVGAWGDWDARGGAAAMDRSLDGVLGGVDFGAGPVRLGVITGYTRSNIDVDARQSAAKSENIHAGAYLGGSWGVFGVRAGAAHSWHKVTTDRIVVAPGFADATHARYDADTDQAFGELSLRFKAGPGAVEPYAALAYVRLKTDGFAETGGSARLTGAVTKSETGFATLGVRGSLDAGGGVTLRAGAGWRYAFEDRVPLTRIAFPDGSSFDIAGVPIAKGAAALDASLDVAVGSNLWIGLRYGGQISDGAADHSVKATLALRF